jgi:hypothetical protein
MESPDGRVASAHRPRVRRRARARPDRHGADLLEAVRDEAGGIRHEDHLGRRPNRNETTGAGAAASTRAETRASMLTVKHLAMQRATERAAPTAGARAPAVILEFGTSRRSDRERRDLEGRDQASSAPSPRRRTAGSTPAVTSRHLASRKPIAPHRFRHTAPVRRPTLTVPSQLGAARAHRNHSCHPTRRKQDRARTRSHESREPSTHEPTQPPER